MAHLIDKDAALAKIDSEIKLLEPYLGACAGQIVAEANSKIAAYIRVMDILDTLEVKEVDLEHLEQEVKDFCYEYDDRKEKWYELCPNDKKLLYNPTWANFAMSIAKHFFELGMAVSNKAQKGGN